MGIVSSAKRPNLTIAHSDSIVSIPDGDSFLREDKLGIDYDDCREVSIPDGDSFLREVAFSLCSWPTSRGFNPRWG